MGKKIDNTERAKAAAIAQMASLLLTSPSLSEEQRSELCRYFADAHSSGLRRKTIESLFLATLQQARDGQSELTPVTTRKIEQKWAEIAAGLGMNPDLRHYRVDGARVYRLERRVRLRRVAFRVASVLVPAIVLLGGVLWLGRDISDSHELADVTSLAAPSFVATHTVETGAGDVRHVVLSDGTEVTLNGNTTFSYNEAREAELSGEAWFHVARDTAHPFTIHSEHLRVTVLGTEFNLSTQNPEGLSTLSLYDGVVELSYSTGTQRLDGAGREFSLDPTTRHASVRPFDPTRTPLWLPSEYSPLDILTLGAILDGIESSYGVTVAGRESLDTARRYKFVLDSTAPLASVMSELAFLSGEFGYRIDGSVITLDKK